MDDGSGWAFGNSELSAGSKVERGEVGEDGDGLGASGGGGDESGLLKYFGTSSPASARLLHTTASQTKAAKLTSSDILMTWPSQGEKVWPDRVCNINIEQSPSKQSNLPYTC